MALELLQACCSLWNTHVQISYFIPHRLPARVLPTVIAQICLKHLWIISIWLIIHGPACWTTVNKVTLFFIWLHSGSHVSRVHNDWSSRGDRRSSAFFCSEHRFGLFSWRWTLTEADLFLSLGWFVFFHRSVVSRAWFRPLVSWEIPEIHRWHVPVRPLIHPAWAGGPVCGSSCRSLSHWSRAVGQSILRSTRLSSYGYSKLKWISYGKVREIPDN